MGGDRTIVPNGGIDFVSGGLSNDWFQSYKTQNNLTILDYENWEYINFYDKGEYSPGEFFFDKIQFLSSSQY